MHLMYVDESGDPGNLLPNTPDHLQPSRHYILTGVIIPDSGWRDCLSTLVRIRRQLKEDHGLPVRYELHGPHLIYSRNDPIYREMTRKRRVEIYRQFLHGIAASLQSVRILSVHLNKLNPLYPSTRISDDFEDLAWSRLLQRYQTFLERSCEGDVGMVFADETNEVKVRKILRRIRVHNYVPSRYGGSYSAPAINIIEDPVIRNSSNSYFIQMADMAVHALYRCLYPSGSLRRFNVDRLYDLLEPRLLKEASPRDPRGIVHL